MIKIFAILLLIFSNGIVNGQEFIPLWPKNKKPNFNGTLVNDSIANERIWKVGTPGMYYFPVPRSENKGTTILICPGGGYERVSYIYNGFQFARWFNAQGINVFILLYRLPHQKDLQQRELAPLQDAQRAMKIIRGNAKKWELLPDKIGVMGISAGGHVASLLGTSVTDVSVVKDTLDATPFHPDFMILLSPVITMGQNAHPGSRKNFLGNDTTKAMIEKYSAELQVTSQTSPAFMVHAQNDNTVPVKNSLLFYNALIDKNISASIHIFPQGGHSIALTDNPGSTDLWLDLLIMWLKEKGFVSSIKK